MSLQDFITHYQVEVIRKAQGYYSDTTGKWIDGVESKFNVDMSIQPANEKDRELLPEAVKTKQIIKIYHEIALKITNSKDKIKGDTFIYNGLNFTVFSTADWYTGDYAIKYYKSFAVQQDLEDSYDS